MEQKISIRFFNDCEVRAAWDDAGNKWMFAVVDVVAILTESKNPRNYWKVLKHRLKAESNELVTKCNQLKMVAADGKRYMTAMKLSPVNPQPIKQLLSGALTDKINDREMFMKGIDYSYYYEQED